MLMASQSLSDREHKAAITEHITVTMVAAVLRLMFISSCKKAVLTSWRDMSEVRAASESRM